MEWISGNSNKTIQLLNITLTLSHVIIWKDCLFHYTLYARATLNNYIYK